MTAKRSGNEAGKVRPDSEGERELSDETFERVRQHLQDGVGYQRPPTHTQFQKGQSGNPKGRPRGTARDLTMADQPTLEAALRAVRKTVKMREGDKVTEVSSIEAVIQATIAAALKGNARSQGLAIDIARTAEQSNARDVARLNEKWTDYKERNYRRLAEAAERNEPEPLILPHPDDVIIDHIHGPKIIGPVTPDDLARCEETVAFCETLIMQNELDERSDVRHNGEPLDEPGSALLLFHLLQRALPPRLKMSDAVMSVRMGRYRAWPKRKLFKELHQSWCKLGSYIPRGTVLPNLRDMQTALVQLHEHLINMDAFGPMKA